MIKLWVLLVFISTGCTINMYNTSTNGRAEDTIDAESSAAADIKPNVSIPAL